MEGLAASTRGGYTPVRGTKDTVREGGNRARRRSPQRCGGKRGAWPYAVLMIPGVDIGKCRMPAILADAAYLILTSDAKAVIGNFFIDDALLAARVRPTSSATA